MWPKHTTTSFCITRMKYSYEFRSTSPVIQKPFCGNARPLSQNTSAVDVSESLLCKGSSRTMLISRQREHRRLEDVSSDGPVQSGMVTLTFATTELLHDPVRQEGDRIGARPRLVLFRRTTASTGRTTPHVSTNQAYTRVARR